jgi:hypothetical protein
MDLSKIGSARLPTGDIAMANVDARVGVSFNSQPCQQLNLILPRLAEAVAWIAGNRRHSTFETQAAHSDQLRVDVARALSTLEQGAKRQFSGGRPGIQSNPWRASRVDHFAAWSP